MAPRVLVSDELSETAVQIFRDRGVEVDYLPTLGKDKEKLAEVIGQYDGLAIRSATKVTEKLLASATNLKVVGRAGIGVDNVDIPAASKKGVIVMNTPFGNSITTAEHAIAMMFAVARQIPEANASTQAGKWEKSRFMGVELFNKTLGVIGAGNIGGIVCDRAVGLKMKVLAYDPFLSAERAVELGSKYLIVDTAGRLHNKSDLMAELGKVKRVIEKGAPLAEVLLVIDGTTGQNGLAQAKIFSEAVEVTGLIVTKLDGSARGGVALAIESELDIPIKFIGTGESAQDFAPFEPEAYIAGLLA